MSTEVKHAHTQSGTGRRRSVLQSWLLTLLVFGLACAAVGAARATSSERRGSGADLRELASGGIGDVAFEPNVGQFDRGAAFGGQFGQGVLLATEDGIRISTPVPAGDHPRISMNMQVGGRCVWTGEGSLASMANYIFGADPRDWRSDVPQYRALRARAVAPGVDLVVYGTAGQLEYDFVLDAGADPRAIRISFPGSSVSVEDDGNLVVSVAGEPVRHLAPRAYQVDGDLARHVACRFVREANGQMSFGLGEYDRALPLVIDPVVVFSKAVQALPQDLDADSLGRFAIVIRTDSFASDIRVSKFTPAGRLLFTTVLTGNGHDDARTVLLAEDGRIFVGGSTTSSDFPVTPDAFDSTYGGGTDGFALQLSADGTTLLYATYLGGSAEDVAVRGALGSDGGFYLVGQTNSADFPTTPDAYDTSFNGQHGDFRRDAFALRIVPDGTGLDFSTYLGGPNGDFATDCVLAGDGSLYVCGYPGADYPTTPGAIAENPGYWPVFVSRLSADGSSLIVSARVSVAGGQAMDVDDDGNVYVGGAGGFGISTGRYFSKLDPGLTTLLYRSYGTAHPNGEVVVDLSVDDDGTVTAGGTVRSKADVTVVPSDGSPYSTVATLPESSSFTALKFVGPGIVLGCGNGWFGFGNAHVSRLSLASSSNIDLCLAQDAPETFVSGTSADFTYAVTNSGSQTAPRVVLELEFGSPLAYGGATSTQGSVALAPAVGASGIVLFDLGDVAPQATVTATVSLGVPCSAAHGIPLQASATVSTLASEQDYSINDAVWTSACSNPAPEINCGNIMLPAAPGACSATVSFAPGVSDNCAGASVTCSPASGSVFPVGTTSVSCSATDSGGRQGYCSFNVSVVDQQPPTMNAPTTYEFVIVAGCTRQVGVFTALANATDNCTPASSIVVTQTPAPSTVLGPGAYPATLTATDLAGNSTLHQFTITIADRIPPTVACPADILILTSAASQVVSYPVPSATDNCPNPSVTCVPPSGSAFPFGTTTVTCTAFDASGNSRNCAFRITLRRPNDTIGVYIASTSTLFLRNDNSPGGADYSYGYGAPGYGLVPVFGDWDNNGTETPGMFYPEARFFFLKNTHAPGGADLSFRAQTTASAYAPIAGDWNGDGVDTTGYFIPSTRQFQLRNVNTAGPATVTFTFSPATGLLQAISGDWNADGVDTVGLYNSATGTFYLRNSNTSGSSQITFAFGPLGGIPIAGDWNGDGITTVGVYEAATGMFHLRNSNSPGPADQVFSYGPLGATPVAGNWDGQ